MSTETQSPLSWQKLQEDKQPFQVLWKDHHGDGMLYRAMVKAVYIGPSGRRGLVASLEFGWFAFFNPVLNLWVKLRIENPFDVSVSTAEFKPYCLRGSPPIAYRVMSSEWGNKECFVVTDTSPYYVNEKDILDVDAGGDRPFFLEH